MFPLLTAIVFLPLAAAAVIALLPAARPAAARRIALAASATDLALAAWMLASSRPPAGAAYADSFRFVEDVAWVPQAGIRYHLGVDGISAPLIFLSALLTLLVVLVSWRTEPKPKTWFAMLMLLAVGMNGVFAALDLVLFYVFWELVLVPMYFIIAVWGGPRRQYAAVKFFLYTLAGSVLMLVGILALYLHPVGGTFDMVALAGSTLPRGFQGWVFAALFLGFAVKVPVFPLHTWLPDAHVEAPTAGSVLLAGVLLKMGAYGFIRVSLPILPDASAAWSPAIAALAAVSIVYGAAVAFAQTDMKKLVAYSSVSHMGFVMLGIAAGTVAGLDGAVAMMFSHGVVTGMLFLLVGMVYDRTRTGVLTEVGGLSRSAPVAGGMLAFASFASLGLPGLSGFVGEFLTLVGAWQSPLWRGFVVAAAAGVVLAAAYMLLLVQRAVLGPPTDKVSGIADLSSAEVGLLAPLVALTVLVGVHWSSLLRFVDPAVRALLAAEGAGG
ncbi:MAG: NADH-quinone oxidoreductase subunit M [Coriobacteriia bacterium]|nr:NADH-quinone oxidoreductase subunit M [Coriobacteriia bacterium]